MSLQFGLGTLNKVGCSPLMCFIRHGHRLRGKPPGIARTLAQRIAGKDIHCGKLKYLITLVIFDF